jgi:hypothetical protein
VLLIRRMLLVLVLLLLLLLLVRMINIFFLASRSRGGSSSVVLHVLQVLQRLLLGGAVRVLVHSCGTGLRAILGSLGLARQHGGLCTGIVVRLSHWSRHRHWGGVS